MDLNTIWFLLVGVLLTGYAILDGFDLGVGVLHLFATKEQQRRIYLNAIGPVWDGNEVWLLTGGGALFAAFPPVYATVFSALYIALVLLLLALMARAVAFEFRGKVDSPGWRRTWDLAFGLGSLLPAVLLGVALGNVLRGLPINADGVYTGTFLGLLNPYALLAGVTSLMLFVMHGALFLTLKTDGDLQAKLGRTAVGVWPVVVVLYVVLMIATQFLAPHLFEAGFGRVLFWVMLALVLLGLVLVPVLTKAKQWLKAFLASAVTVAGMVGAAAVCLYPRMVPALPDLANSLTIHNASSTDRTLWVMLIIALIGVPIVLVYTAVIYWIFRGKVELSEHSY